MLVEWRGGFQFQFQNGLLILDEINKLWCCTARFDFGFDLVFDFAFDSPPLGTPPFVHYRKWIRNEGCLSAASFLHFPFFVVHKRALPEGASLRSPFFDDFLWRSKESHSAARPRPALCPQRAINLIKARHATDAAVLQPALERR